MVIALFGGSGGLGSKLAPLLQTKHTVIQLGSKDVDITNVNQVEDFFNQNEIDTVLNFSGLNCDGLIHKIQEEDIRKIIEVNIMGNFNIMRGCIPKMREKKFGRIICISSILSIKPIKGTSVYSGSKAFIDSMVKTCALENAKYGITCNSIQLGYFEGGLTNKVPENILRPVVEKILFGRLGKSEEIFNTIEFILSTEYLTGANIELTGGLSII